MVRERERPREPVEEPDAQVGLESADMLRDGTLRHAELLRREAKVQMPRRRLEGAECVQRRQSAATLLHPVDFLHLQH
jgi:hypothetical protein